MDRKRLTKKGRNRTFSLANMKKNIKGMTLIEVMIALTVSVIIFLISTNILVTLFYTDTKNKNVQSLEQVKNDLQSEFSNGIRWGKTIQIGGTSGVVIDGSVYILADSQIFKDGKSITSTEVKIKSFEVKNRSLNSDEVSLEIVVEMEHATLTSVEDTMRLVVSQRKTNFLEGS